MSEQNIKTRMIQKAASIWGVRPNEIESSFDPLIALLIAACASEVEKIESEVKNSQTRITEQLIQLMTPEVIYGARPSYAIAYTEPVEPVVTIQPENTQYYKKKISTKNAGVDFKNVFFSPAKNTKLIDAEITHVICGDKLYSTSSVTKNIYLDTLRKYAVPSKLYLGIKSESDNIPLKDISIFFELQNLAHKDIFYHHLRNIECKLNSKKIITSGGFYDSESSDEENVDIFLNSVSSKTKNIEIQANQYFEKNFITIKSITSLSKKGKVIENQFTQEELEKYPELAQLNWLEIVFPRIIDNSILEEVFCSLNAFPVINRKLNAINYQIKDYINVVPLVTDDLFLDIKEVENINGKKYNFRNSASSESQKGTFVVRDKNVGKLDTRSAKQYLMHMLELLKNESSSFAHFGSDFLNTNIEKVNQTISLIEKKVEDFNNLPQETMYLSIKPYDLRETLTIEYWTTNGELGNNVKAGSELQVYRGTELKPKSGMLLTKSFQGKDSFTMEERLNAYRSALLSRDRIVTKEDVKALCKLIYNQRVDEIEVKRSYSSDISPHVGVVPCIDIMLKPSTSVKTSDSEWQFLENNLLTVLEKQSLNVFPYIVKRVV